MEIVGRLAAGVAHDFNNLLTVINGRSQWLLDRMPSGDPGRGSLEEILQAGQQAADLTRQLLAFSRLQPVEPQWFDLNQVVDRIGILLRRLLGESIVLDIRTGASLPLLRADPHQLEQVVMNLAVNARDAMPQGGALVVSTEDTEIDGDSYLCLSVRDTGAGIGEAARGRMFEPFFTTKPAGEGTGLGLTLVRDIVDNSGGRVEVDSDIGRGTAVSLYWKSRTEAPLAPLLGPLRIVIADDHPAVRSWMRDVLESGGAAMEIREAADGGEAIRLVREGGVDLLITDLIMPGKEGIETIQTVRREAPDLAILAISGSIHSEFLHAARALGAHATLRKPLNAEELLAAVAKLLPLQA
jgi:CheY-like chemotaxis protein/anti-sigma regulatory factor (Ser/Thr protein kinase)